MIQSGAVHYSFPSRETDIHAELEIDLGALAPDVTAESLVSEEQGRTVKTLCIKDKQHVGADNAASEQDLLPKILARFTRLRELHWHNCTLDDRSNNESDN